MKGDLLFIDNNNNIIKERKNAERGNKTAHIPIDRYTNMS